MSWAPWRERGTVPAAVGLPVVGLERDRPGFWRIVGGVVYFAAVGAWAVFLLMMAMSPDTLTEVWQWFRDLERPLQIAGWLMAMPWTAGLAAWESSWPALARLAIVVVLAFGTVLAYAPRPRDRSY